MASKTQVAIQLPYYKQGDDLNHYLAKSANVVAAMQLHGRALVEGARILNDLADLIEPFLSGPIPVEIFADTHCITVSGPPMLIEEIRKANLHAQFVDEQGNVVEPFLNDEYEEEYEDEYEEEYEEELVGACDHADHDEEEEEEEETSDNLDEEA